MITLVVSISDNSVRGFKQSAAPFSISRLGRTGRSILSTNNLATAFRQGTASAVPLHARGAGVLTPEACVRRLLGPCLRNVAVTTTHSSLVTRPSQAEASWPPSSRGIPSPSPLARLAHFAQIHDRPYLNRSKSILKARLL